MPKTNDKSDDKIATTDSMRSNSNVALGNEEKKIADNSELGLKPQEGEPVNATVETTKPAEVVDTENDNKDAKDSVKSKIFAEYEKGAFNPEQIAEKFNTTGPVVYQIIDEMSEKKHGDTEEK